jgi:hypothetical protein
MWLPEQGPSENTVVSEPLREPAECPGTGATNRLHRPRRRAEQPADAPQLAPAAEHRPAFRRALKWRTGSEGRISTLKRRYDWDSTEHGLKIRQPTFSLAARRSK